MNDEVRCPVCGKVMTIILPVAMYFRCDGAARGSHPDGVLVSVMDPRLDPKVVERIVRQAKACARLKAFKLRTGT